MIGLVVIVVTALLYGGSASAVSDLTHHEVLDENGDFLLSWTFDDEQIEFEARVKTRGWLGLGLSPNGGMPGSDIVIGWVKDGQTHLTDRYADEKALPPEDESQDWELLSGYENDTHTVLRFKRKLQTCDVRDRVINKDTLRVLWAWNDEDPDDDAGPAYHLQNRGVRSSVFLRNNIESETVPSIIQSYDVTMKNATIPPKRTAYWCRLVEMPKLQTKHHIFKVQSVITPGNEGMVHHMIVYKCHPNPNRTVSPNEHPGHECFTPNMPQDWMECYKGSLIAAWAVGTGDVSFPSHVGYPIGDEYDGGQVLLEVHYDNPLLKEGTTDNSGLTFLYTPELRQYDAGILAVMSSVDYSHIVPPYADDFRTETFCNQECLSAFMDEVGEPIRVFGNMPHAHLLARKIRTSLIRNGVETVLSQDDNFDFNLQYVRMLDEEFIIQKGDTIMTECTYNSAHQNQAVYVDDNIKFTQESCQNNMLPFLDTKTIIEKDGNLQFEVYRKPTHTDQYLAFDSHHPLEHKLAVIKTLFHRADNVITSDEAKTEEHRHLRVALAKCGYQNWTFNKALKPSDQSKKTLKCRPLTNRNKVNITIPYVQGVSEKLRRIFQNFNIATNFKPHSTLRQKLVHPKDRPEKGIKANVIYKLKCKEPNCNNMYIGETSRPLKESYSLEAPGWINNIPIVKPVNMSNMTYEDVVESIVWDQDKAQRFSRHLREGTFISDCGFRGQSFHGTSRFRKESPLPRASVPAAAPEDVCSTSSVTAGPEMSAMPGVLSLVIFSVLSTP
ncbi:MOXD1 [Branchiostoma lanceolatum]|uniref:MOXD1 protein n=1 Tax=Branchiostoma lanceolatum TaxID=7740 RepID=A0A8J9VBY2_BRALA|nr:MOXD1 [Branchiostoma lanceolatum]